jgi:hypothetical protein
MPPGQPPGQPPPPNPQQMAMMQAQQQQQRQQMMQRAALAQQQNPTPPPQGVPPGLATFARGAAAPSGPPNGQRMGLNPQEAARLGRFGDSVISHLTPGEITIPPRLQSPQLIARLQEALRPTGIPLQSLVAGRPNAVRNPNTGLEEHAGFLDAILPALLGIGGSILAPEALPALGLSDVLGTGAASAIGGGIGSAAGSALGGGNAGQSITAGLGAGLGNAALGALTGGTGSAAGSTSDAANFPSPTSTPFGSPASTSLAQEYAAQGGAGGIGTPGAGLQGSMLSGAQPSGLNPPGFNPGTIGGSGGSGGLLSMFGGGAGSGPLSGGQLALRGLGAGLGGTVGQALSPATPKLSLPQGSIPYSNPSGPNPQSGAPGRPSFTNYNPFASATGQPYNFFPPSAAPTPG